MASSMREPHFTQSNMDKNLILFFCLSLIISSSYTTQSFQIFTDVEHPASDTAVFADQVEHWLAIYQLELQELSYKLHIHRAKPILVTKQLFQSQVHVGKVETGHHGNLIYNHHFKATKSSFHNFLRSFRQEPVTSSLTGS